MIAFPEKILAQLKETGLLPVVCLRSEEELDTFMKALVPTPVRCVEITLRHPFSPEAIRRIKNEYPGFTVGAGTVMLESSFRDAVGSGADFCVSPGFDPEIVREAAGMGMPFLPGCSHPSEIQQAVKSGLTALKFFPAECMGGVKALQLYKGAFAGISFLPTGGITAENYLQYLACSNVVACGGSFMIPADKLAAGDAEGIRETVMGHLNAIKEGVK